MAGQVSYLSRFLGKFVEILGAGLASALCAFLLAHFGGYLSPSSGRTPPPVKAAIEAVMEPASPATATAPATTAAPAMTAAPAAAEVIDERPAKPEADGPAAQAAPKPVRATKASPPPNPGRTEAGAAEKRPSGMSAEALARAALANIDASRAAATDGAPPRATEAARDAEAQPRATGATSLARPSEIRPMSTVDIPSRPVAGIEGPPSASAQHAGGPPLEVAAAPPQQPAAHERNLFSGFKLIPDLLRPASTPTTPRPPLPVGAAPVE
jgi:hypothetical protein